MTKAGYHRIMGCAGIAMGVLLGRDARAQANVHFDRGDKPSVVVIDSGQCTTPCTMFMAAGAHTIKIDGNATDVKVPVTHGSTNANFRANIDLVDVVGGSAVAGVGLITGIFVLIMQTGAFSGYDDNGYQTGLTPLAPGGGAIFLSVCAALILGGGIWLGFGILASSPRVVVGSNQIHPAITPGGIGLTF